MVSTRIVYDGNLRTTNEHIRSQTQIITDAPLDNHGLGEAFSPTDLVATSLGACMLTIMGIRAERLNMNLKGMCCEVTKVMADAPRRIARIVIAVQMPLSIPVDEREKYEKVAEACPVAKSLSPDIEQALSFEYVL